MNKPEKILDNILITAHQLDYTDEKSVILDRLEVILNEFRKILLKFDTVYMDEFVEYNKKIFKNLEH